MKDTQVAILRAQIERKIRKNTEPMNATSTVSERLSHFFSQFGRKTSTQVIDWLEEVHTKQEVERILTFAKQISEENNVSGELAQDQFDRAELLAMREHLRNKARQIEEGINQATNVTERTRKFAQAMAKIYNKYGMESAEAGLDPRHSSKESLRTITKNIATDIGELRRNYHRGTSNEMTG